MNNILVEWMIISEGGKHTGKKSEILSFGTVTKSAVEAFHRYTAGEPEAGVLCNLTRRNETSARRNA